MASDDTEMTKAASALRPRRALVLFVVAWAVVQAAIHLLPHLPGIPYNAAQLFEPTYLPMRIAVFSLMALWASFAPAWVAGFTARGRARRVFFLPLWAAGVSLAAWPMLQFAVTPESLWDILGWPVLDWPGDLELIGRFLTLAGGFVLAVIVGQMSVTAIVDREVRGRGLARWLAALAWSLPWLILAWMVVIKWASTDNLTELVRSSYSHCGGPVSLSLLAMMIGASAAALGVAMLRCGAYGKVIGVLVTLVLLAGGWVLLQLGLEPAVEKYGEVFPAVRFLLGASRHADISNSALALRWCAVQLAVVVALTWGYLTAASLSPVLPPPSRHDKPL